MSCIMAPAEEYITEWQKAGLLQPQHFMDRMDQEIHRSALYSSDADLANITPYMNDLQDGVPAMSQASFQTTLKQQVPTLGLTALEKATPVLFRMFMYISRYPFLPVPTNPEASRLTRNELLRALAFLSLSDDLRFFNNEPDLGTRARTPADHRRLLFQALARPTTANPIAFDEAAWTAKAAVRASRFFRPSEPTDEWETDNAMTNRDADGDECFHDVVDYMYTLQPVNEGQYGGDERRRDLVDKVTSVAVMRSRRWRVECIRSSDIAVYSPVYVHRHEIAWLGVVQGSADSLTGDSWELMLTSGSMGTDLSGGLKKST